jgi:hypothetical protein
MKGEKKEKKKFKDMERWENVSLIIFLGLKANVKLSEKAYRQELNIKWAVSWPDKFLIQFKVLYFKVHLKFYSTLVTISFEE